MRNFFLSCLLFINACTTAQNNHALKSQDFLDSINKNSPQILDVRTEKEYQSGHIKNALLADWNAPEEFARRINFIDKKKPVFVYCLAGGRSAAAASSMREQGFEQVIELKGGMNAWRKANLPIESNLSEPQLSIESFTKDINSNQMVLVDFGAVWCPPCRKMEPVLNDIQKKYSNRLVILKVDGNKDFDLMKQFNVTALPVLIIFKNGKQVWRRDGVATEEEMTEQLDAK